MAQAEELFIDWLQFELDLLISVGGEKTLKRLRSMNDVTGDWILLWQTGEKLEYRAEKLKLS